MGMQYRRISADCHLDLPWLPAELFVSEAKRELRERMPYVEDSPDGPRWTTKSGINMGLVGGVGSAISGVVGVLWGAMAGYFGGRIDSPLMRIVDILYSLPNIVFVIVLIATFETPLQGLLEAHSVNISARVLLIVVGLGAISWLTMARIVRGQVLSLRTRGFVSASRALGASHVRILRRHILPDVYGIIITYLTLTVPAIILYESFLSYLGLGIQPPQASLGSLLAEGAAQINPIRIYWWMIVHPGATLAATLLALNFLGDGLRDAWDPRTESE